MPLGKWTGSVMIVSIIGSGKEVGGGGRGEEEGRRGRSQQLYKQVTTINQSNWAINRWLQIPLLWRPISIFFTTFLLLC